jgi:hypothetical protein
LPQPVLRREQNRPGLQVRGKPAPSEPGLAKILSAILRHFVGLRVRGFDLV